MFIFGNESTSTERVDAAKEPGESLLRMSCPCLPTPLPVPRPTRTFFLRAPGLSLRSINVTCVCVRGACMRACVCACVRACVRA